MGGHRGRPGDLGVDMGVTSSMQYTVGTALERARQAAHDVEVLVDGHWVSGTVLVTDGTGVVLEREDREHSVVRLDRISAVRVAASAPMRPQIAPARVGVDRNLDGSIVMPAPRQASA